MCKQAWSNHEHDSDDPVEPRDMKWNKSNHKPSEYKTCENGQDLNTYFLENTKEQWCLEGHSSYPNNHNPINPFFAFLSCKTIKKVYGQNHENNRIWAQEIMPSWISMSKNEKIEPNDNQSGTNSNFKFLKHQCQIGDFVEWTSFWSIID